MKHPGLTNFSKSNQPKEFNWSEENIRKIDKIIEKYPKGKQQSAVIPLLDLAQRQNNGWLSNIAIEKVSQKLDMSFIRVMEIATFYSMFNLEPIGKNFIQICRTTPCWLRGCDKLTKIAKNFTNCDLGSISKDGLFTVVEVECLGACCNAPVVQINDNYFEDLDPEKLNNIIDQINKNEMPKPGSYKGRLNSEPENIRKTLLGNKNA